MDSVIQIKNLTVSTKHQVILDDISLDIPKNKVTVLLGASGCGKTTLLKCLNRLNDLNKELDVTGSILFENKDILSVKKIELYDIRQKMGLLSQQPCPLPMSIFDNVAYGVRLKGIKRKTQVETIVMNSLLEVGLWDEVKNRLQSSAYSLSIGQQQRLCLARGLAVKPLIILADEPTSALDPVSSNIIETKLKELKKDHSIILVTHILRQAKRLADNVVYMSYGKIIEQGKPDDLFNNPQTQQLKDYIINGN
jgi:phosphate transport system ATP-binding protein